VRNFVSHFEKETQNEGFGEQSVEEDILTKNGGEKRTVMNFIVCALHVLWLG